MIVERGRRFEDIAVVATADIWIAHLNNNKVSVVVVVVVLHPPNGEIGDEKVIALLPHCYGDIHLMISRFTGLLQVCDQRGRTSATYPLSLEPERHSGGYRGEQVVYSKRPTCVLQMYTAGRLLQTSVRRAARVGVIERCPQFISALLQAVPSRHCAGGGRGLCKNPP